MRQDALENEEEDNRRKQEVEKLNIIDSTIFQTEKQISDLEERMTDEDREAVNEQLENLKKIQEEKDFDNMESSLQKLNEVWGPISTRLYQEASENVETDVDNDEQSVDVDSTDVEFEEVKE